MMERVVVTRPIVGIYAMQVCAEKDATDEEILSVCNGENPAGTIHGWTRVFREVDEYHGENLLPVQCESYDDRLHFIVFC